MSTKRGEPQKHISWFCVLAALTVGCGDEGESGAKLDGGGPAGGLDAGFDVAVQLDGGNAAVDAPMTADVFIRLDGSEPADAGGNADAKIEGDANIDAAPVTCDLGQATSQATADNLSLFGTPVYFEEGASLPAGTYILSYVDGCNKYNVAQGWTVNAFAPGGCCNWWLVGDSTADKKVGLPGNVGVFAGSGAHAEFEDCVAASKLLPTVTYEHPGGKLGIWLQDSNYPDNVAGLDGRNPKWSLKRLGACD